MTAPVFNLAPVYLALVFQSIIASLSLYLMSVSALTSVSSKIFIVNILSRAFESTTYRRYKYVSATAKQSSPLFWMWIRANGLPGTLWEGRRMVNISVLLV